MNTQLTIKNFRVFDENGVSINIKPLTILTGCNSSGKSSIVKASFLLNSFMKQINDAIEKGEKLQLDKYKLDFTGYPNNLLGRFDKVIPEGSESHKITLGYTIHSYMLAKDVDVQLVFAEDKNDDLNNAYLVSFSMSTDEGVFYSSDKVNGSMFNLNIIKDSLLTFAPIDYLISQFCITYSMPDPRDFGFSEDNSEEELKAIISQLREIGKERVMEVVKYNRFKKDIKRNDSNYKEDQINILKWTEENDSFFNIPVLEYLRTVKKGDLMAVVENELVSNDGRNAYLAEKPAVLAASLKVVNDFLNADFDSFDAYFKDFEHRHFENVIVSDVKNCPCLASVSINQHFIRNYPGSGWSGALFTWDEDGKAVQEKEEKTPQQRIKEWEEKPLTFDDLYSIVMLWNEKYNPNKSEFYKGGGSEVGLFGEKEFMPGNFDHHAFEMLASFAEKVIHEVLFSTGFENMSYVSSSRATVKRLYALDEKDDFTDLLKRYFESKRLFEERKKFMKPDYHVNDFMNRWIKQFGFGHSLSFKLDEEGLGVKIRLYKSSDDKCGRLLFDEGYGITQLISILLQIETAIISAKEEKANKESVEGLSAFDEYDKVKYHFEENTIAIEEPEIHLHPSYQSKLAEMFVEAYQKYNIHFMIETHSEYLIRKLQTLVAKKNISEDDISIQYVYSPSVEARPLYTPQIKSISVKSDGRLTDSFGSGFFDEADNAAMELLSLKE